MFFHYYLLIQSSELVSSWRLSSMALYTIMAPHGTPSALLIIIIILMDCRLSEAERCTIQPIPNADVHLIFVSSEEADCKSGSVGSSELVQNAEKILESINHNQTVKFGLQVVPMCSNDQKSRLRVGAEISRQLSVADFCPNGVGEKVVDQNSTLVGVISPGHLDMQQLLAGTNIPLITIGETAATPSGGNVYQANNHLMLRAKAIAELAVKLNIDFTTVLHGTDSTSQDLKFLLERQLEGNLICVDEFVEFSQSSPGPQIATNVSGPGKPRGVILIGVPDNTNVTHKTNEHLTWIVSPQLPEKDNFAFVRNPFDTVHIVKQYQSTSLGIANLDQMTATLHLVAKSVQTVVNVKCSGQLANCLDMGVEQLQTLTNKQLKSVEIGYDENFGQRQAGTFRFVDQVLRHEPELPLYYRLSSKIRGEQPEYAVPDGWNIDSVAADSNDFWCINEDCKEKCSKQIKPKNFIYVPGEYIIVVTAPIHDRFNPYPDLWSCIDFNNEASLRAEAALYARDRLQILLNDTGIDIGLLVLDTCFNTALTQKLLTDVLNGSTDYCYRGDCLNRSKIIGLVGDYSSHISITEQRLMMPANLLQVAYGASTWKLDDKDVFTHFLRTHPTATRVTANLIKVLENLKSAGQAEINSVVLMHTNSLYGNSGAELLNMKLNESSYCILETFELNYFAPETSDTYDHIWDTLIGYKGKGFIVIYVGEEKPIRDLLDNMKLLDKNWWKDSGSIFIMTEVWEDRLPLIQDYGSILRGSLTFKLTPDFGVVGFKEHLLDLRPDSSDRNPWFATMYQRQIGCKVRGSFETSFFTICLQDQPYSGADADINIEIYALYTIKAIYAFGYGFKDYVTEECEGSIDNCDKLYARTLESSQELKHYVGRVTIPLNDSSSQRDGKNGIKPFDEKFDGTSGFQVFSQQQKLASSKHEYVLVYEFNSDDELSIPDPENVPKFYKRITYDETDNEQEKLISTSCDLPQCMSYCFSSTETGPITSTSQHPMVVYQSTIRILIPLGIVILILLIVVIVLTINKYHNLGKICRHDEKPRLSECDTDTDTDTGRSAHGSDSTYMTADRELPALPVPAYKPSPPFVVYRRDSETARVARLKGPDSVIGGVQGINGSYNNGMSDGSGSFSNSSGNRNNGNSNGNRDNGNSSGSKSNNSLSILCFEEQEESPYTLPTEPDVNNSFTDIGGQTVKPTPLPRQNSQGVYSGIINMELVPPAYSKN